MKLLFVTVAAGLLLALGVPSAADDLHAGVEPLRGTWSLRCTADARHTDAGSPDCTMSVSGAGRVVLRIGTLVTNEGTILLSRDGKRHHIDLKLDTGLVLGVFHQDGDELTICCDHAGKARPRSLTPTRTQWLERWRRATH